MKKWWEWKVVEWIYDYGIGYLLAVVFGIFVARLIIGIIKAWPWYG